MKKSQLQQIIREEVRKIMTEAPKMDWNQYIKKWNTSFKNFAKKQQLSGAPLSEVETGYGPRDQRTPDLVEFTVYINDKVNVNYKMQFNHHVDMTPTPPPNVNIRAMVFKNNKFIKRVESELRGTTLTTNEGLWKAIENFHNKKVAIYI